MRLVTVNWSLIDGAWRAGILSIRSIAHEYTKLTGESVSPAGIKKHYTELGLARDLTQKINEKAQQLVNRELVNSQIDSHKLLTNRISITEDSIVDANAELDNNAI